MGGGIGQSPERSQPWSPGEGGGAGREGDRGQQMCSPHPSMELGMRSGERVGFSVGCMHRQDSPGCRASGGRDEGLV